MTKEQIILDKAEKNDKNFNAESLPIKVEDIFIFSHEFAKAFWGEEVCEMECSVVETKKWKYHLQQMVLEEKPLKYLEKFL